MSAPQNAPLNAYEAGTRKIIPAVLIYLRTKDDKILMMHRLGGEGGGKPGDYHSGKWNGLGGKLELNESPWEAAKRELKEESGIALPETAFKALGTLHFPNFKAHRNEDWICFVFEAQTEMWAADMKLGPCTEGELAWISASKLTSLNLWPGDHHFIPLVIARKRFLGTIWYDGQVVKRYQISEI